MMRFRSWIALPVVCVLAAWAVTGLQGRSSLNNDGPSRQAQCAAWDRRANEGIANLTVDGSARAEWMLDQALLQLRRARKYCDAGAIQVAYHDYTSLHRRFPPVAAATASQASATGIAP